MTIHKSAEDYLEAILILTEEKGSVRSIDVVHHLNVSKPSVSRAMGLLRDGGYLTVEDGGFLKLTEAGFEIADKIYERHRILTTLLTQIGVSPKTAAEDACLIEHDISNETFACIKKHISGQ